MAILAEWLSAVRRLLAIDFASAVEDAEKLPGNRMEKLDGDRPGRRGIRVIRIHDQFRVCFLWDGEDAWNVEIVD